MKKNAFLVCLLVATVADAQQPATPTSTFLVTGAVEKEHVFDYAQITSLPEQTLADLVITNHLGEPRGTARNLKGVLLRDLLKSVTIKAESPKVLSEFYLTLIAADGYKVVFSWNELFNSDTGSHVYLITEKDGKRLTELPERILLITETDHKTGRRHVKNLARVVVARTL
jgi:hypothetical protein